MRKEEKGTSFLLSKSATVSKGRTTVSNLQSTKMLNNDLSIEHPDASRTSENYNRNRTQTEFKKN